jgi:hypothetical protein
MIKEEVLRPLFDSFISSVFDPEPVRFRAADECGVSPVRNACRKTLGVVHKSRIALNRNAFLCGCLDLTENEEIEHIIFGFGYKHGRTTKIYDIAHVEGLANKVGIPQLLQEDLLRHVADDHQAEVLIFHNHPRNELNILFDNAPLASNIDRQTLLNFYTQPLIALKSLMRGGRVRCYLGENGYVREFRTPNLLGLIDGLSRIRR